MSSKQQQTTSKQQRTTNKTKNMESKYLRSGNIDKGKNKEYHELEKSNTPFIKPPRRTSLWKNSQRKLRPLAAYNFSIINYIIPDKNSSPSTRHRKKDKVDIFFHA